MSLNEALGMYEKVVVGGTFDVIHKGHKVLLKKAFNLSRFVSIGLTTDEYAKKIKSYPVIGYGKRKKLLEDLLKREGWTKRYEIVPLNDPYGVTTSSEDVAAIVVSEETLGRAREINLIRRRKRLYPLDIVCVGMVWAEDKKPITTTRIREGELDLEGSVLR